MELLNVTLSNYRRFDKETTIDFAQGAKNVTIIRAENGAGKTGILMALLFGLFGIVQYEQFQIADDRDFMVSSPLLSDGKTAECTVSIEFLDDGKKYKIVRKIKASNVNGTIWQDNEHVNTTLYEDGIEKGWTKGQIDEFMNGIVGENIRGFLFFDGVKYTDLFKHNDKTTRDELQKIIEKMLNINDLDKAIAILKSLASNINSSKVGKKTATKIANVKTEIAGLERKQGDIEDRISEKTRIIEEYEEDERKLQEKLSSVDKYKPILEQIRLLNGSIEKDKAQLNVLRPSIIGSAKDFLLNLVYSVYGKDSAPAFEEIGNSQKGGADLVRLILKQDKCICCDEPLSEEKRHNLEKYLNELSNGVYYPPKLVSEAQDHLASISKSSDSGLFLRTYKDIKDLVGDINKKRTDLEAKKSKLPDDENFDAERIERDSMENNREMGSMRTLKNAAIIEKSNLQSDLDEVVGSLKKAEKELADLEKLAAAESGQQKQYDYYTSTHEYLSDLKKKYLTEAKTDISDRANEYFLKLISEDDKAKFSKLVLDDNYGIKVYQSDGQEIFGQMSAGQKLLASMAFVMGLTAVAANAKPTCNFPLVMDTPFSNLDLKNRESLIKLMPTVVKQWIITPIDTELTEKEIAYFGKGGRVGNVYSLKKKGAATELVEYEHVMDLIGS